MIPRDSRQTLKQLRSIALIDVLMTRILLRLLPCTALAFLLAGCTPTGRPSHSSASLPQATAPAATPAPQPTTPPPAAAPNPEQQQINNLIAKVEAAYAAGDADYKKGRLPQAKVEFDRAVDLMLSSGIDIKGNPQLQDEFNRVVDRVNALEMEALQQGNGFTPKVEPTPADVANDVTFKVDPNFVARAKTDLATTHSDLPLVMNDYVAAFINFFANTQRGHNTLLHSFERAGRYKTMIQRVLAEEGVPQDLIYLAVAESGFQPRALNRGSGAGGMWQFMPYGNYGLTRSRFVDERFDPEKSTRAYARYMKFLYDQLGDWYLAMAAYDHGAGNIQRAVARTGYASFWELYQRHELPSETENYVPEILAAIIIASHPKQYGFDDITLDPPVVTDTVSVDYAVDLRLVSDLIDAPVAELVALNPSLLGYVTPPDSSFDLHLPAGTASLFEQRIAAIPESKRDAWRYHRVAAGDTLASVALEFHVPVSELAETNQLGVHDSLDGVQALVVPVPRTSSRGLLYTVRRGDTLISIADRFGVSLSDLRRWNHIRGIHVRPGRRIHVAQPVPVTRLRRHARSRRSTAHHASTAHHKSAAHAKKRAKSSGSSPTHSKSAGKN
ncbi:MAG TPA: transglycosylase SLT domain-containing protein [Terracidiphilus sp.]|nr:transglycosylase SLT domain-containing protein [Terracidiphilus sp.]